MGIQAEHQPCHTYPLQVPVQELARRQEPSETKEQFTKQLLNGSGLLSG
jgi:hypothetical protein